MAQKRVVTFNNNIQDQDLAYIYTLHARADLQTEEKKVELNV